MLEVAIQRLLAPAALGFDEIARIMGRLLGGAVSSGDLYCQHSVHESWQLEDGFVKTGDYSVRQGVGVRAISDEKTGFAYSARISAAGIDQAVAAARAICRGGGADRDIAIQSREPLGRPYRGDDPLCAWPDAEKLALLERVDRAARAYDPGITGVVATLTGRYDVILVVDELGRLVADVRPLVHLNVNVIAEKKGRRERGAAGGGGRVDYEYFASDERAEGFAREAARQAAVKPNAVAGPAGTMPVVLGPGWPGILLHEAVGHGLEGDFNRKGTSAFAGRLGERVAALGVTVVDDGTLPRRRGSLSIDDEGTDSAHNVLIQDGMLIGYLMDRHNARLLGMMPTGNGRRQSFAHRPMPRMTNTYMANGPYNPAEIVASVANGLYAVNFGGGQVDITSGKFVFSASEAYLIENHRVTYPVKGATLIGNGPDILHRVTMIGNDLALDEGIGHCNKRNQTVPVGVGQPTLRVDAITVGGTQA